MFSLTDNKSSVLQLCAGCEIHYHPMMSHDGMQAVNTLERGVLWLIFLFISGEDRTKSARLNKTLCQPSPKRRKTFFKAPNCCRILPFARQNYYSFDISP